MKDKKKCFICNKLDYCQQHHIYHRRYSDEVIDICDLCHKKVHNPTAYKLPVDWAYENGYLIRHNTSYNISMKKLKNKSCSHSKSFFDGRLGYIKCNYCGQRVNEIKFGSSKVKSDKKVAQVTQKALKMGYEKQDPRIFEASKLENKIKSLGISLRKFKHNSDKLKLLNEERDKLVGLLKEIERSYE